MTPAQKAKELLAQTGANKRLSPADGLFLLKHANLLDLGWAANSIRTSLHGSNAPVTFVIDRNVNYTNICITACQFCAFSVRPGSQSGYLLPYATIADKVKELIDIGGTQLLIQGGHNPELGIEYFEDLINHLRVDFPNLTIHGLSPSEIHHISQVSNLSLDQTIVRLISAGLSSVAGGGAEILTDRIRYKLSPKKISAQDWLEIMGLAHKHGLHSSATMVFGGIETSEDVIEHLCAIRNLQDKTSGFTAFITWSFQPGQTELAAHVSYKASAVKYLRTIAICRLMLDNIKNIQASWVTQGTELGQVAFTFGANDFGGTMLEENVLSAAGTTYHTTVAAMINCIHKAGYDAAQRDTQYKILKVFPNIAR